MSLDRDYLFQLEEKRLALEQQLQKLPPLAQWKVAPVIADPNPYFYRNKAIYPFARVRSKTMAGFYQRGSHFVVDVQECQIQEPCLTELANRVRQIVTREKISIYEESSQHGFLRAMFLRVAPGTGELMLALITRSGLFPESKTLVSQIENVAKNLKTRDGKTVRLVSIMRNIRDEPNNVILGKRSLPLLGRDHLFDRLDQLRLKLSLTSFYQVNSSQTRAAYQLMKELAGESAKGRVVDAYAGIGSIALFLAQDAKEVIAIEEVKRAVEDAQFNARENGFENLKFLAGTVEEMLPTISGEIDLLILDPPRSGCADSVLKTIAGQKPKRILYLSCSTESLARDLESLLANGFQVKEIRPIDFFPHTPHLEILVRLDRID